MAIIYTYPLNSIIRGEDMLIGTSTKIVDGYPKNVTKNFSIADLTDFVRVNVSLDDVLAVNNVSTRDAKIGALYLYDTPLLDYGNISLNQNNFVFSTVASGEVFKVRKGFFRTLSSNNTWGNFLFSLLTDNRSWDLPDKDGTFAMLSDIPVVSGFVPTSRTLTINGVTYDLSANRSWTISTSGGEWGSITGNILDQTDLITYLEENYYPLNSNPAGYLTQQEVEEYPDLVSFPPTGTIGVIYIALDTGLFYTWNGSAYILSAAPDTGITGGGIVNRLPKFTPDGVTIGSSNFSDNGTVGRYTQGSSFVEFITGSNIWLRLQRSTTNRMDFILGNSGIGQPAEITTNNAAGLELKSTGASGYISLKAGASSLEGIRVLSTGKLQFTQVPDAGATSDSLLVRDSSGNVKILPYPTIPSTSTLVPYTGATANVDLGTYGLLAEYLEVNTTPTTYTPAVGRLGWNDTDGTLEFKLKGGNVTLQIGQEQVIRVINKTTPLINLLESNYQVCVVSGATGQRVSVRLAQADSDANSAGTLGVVTENINANQEGFITTSGQVREINTTGSLQGETWSDGDILYLSPTTAGAVTNIKPTAPYHTVIVGYVEYAHAIHGKIYVKIDNGYELDELHNVKITSPQSNDVLMYNSTDSLWENKDPFDYFDARSVAYQKHINMPIIGNAGVNNVEGVGVVVGGGTARAWVGTNIVTKTQRLGLVTATTGNPAQIRQINNYITREDGFSTISGFNMAENASDSTVRFFIGLSTLSIFSNVEANTLINCIGFCKLTTSNNVNIVHNDNTGTATTIDLGSNFPANTISTDKYFLYWETVPTGVYLKISRIGTIYSYETIITTDIPATTTALNFGAYVVDSTGASVTTGADWYGTYIRILS